jgi:hypothetical protein
VTHAARQRAGRAQVRGCSRRSPILRCSGRPISSIAGSPPVPAGSGSATFTYIAAWYGFAYVAFVTDVYSRRIVGWNVASTLRAEILPMQALDMAAWDAGDDLTGLTHHSDHGSNFMAMVYTDQIVELGAVPSTGTVVDSFDNAMAEAVNNLYKTELVRQRGPGGPLSRSNWRRSNGCGGGTTSASTANSTCTPHSRSRPRTTVTSNQPTRHLPHKPHRRTESQADPTASAWSVVAEHQRVMAGHFRPRDTGLRSPVGRRQREFLDIARRQLSIQL